MMWKCRLCDKEIDSYLFGTCMECINRLITEEEVRQREQSKWDWTSREGRTNSSTLFNKIAQNVCDTIRSEARTLLDGNCGAVARLIVSKIAHEHHLGPFPPFYPFEGFHKYEEDLTPGLRICKHCTKPKTDSIHKYSE